MTLRRRLKYLLYNSVPFVAGRFPYYGVTVHFPPGAMVFRVVCEQGRFEPDIVDRLVRFARPGTTVLDVGANIGLMAIPVLWHHATCRVLSFEPSPNSLPFLERTVAGSRFRDRWQVVPRALAAAGGELAFSLGRPEHALFEGFLPDDRLEGGRTIRVAVSTLDEEWARAGRPDVSAIKIDVEGAEQGVLAGAHEVVRAHRPTILVEWHEPYLRRYGTAPSWLLAFARDHGYRIFTIPAGLPVDDEASLTVQMIDCQNFLLVQADALFPAPSMDAR